jgi:hypothetical protein
MTGKQWPVATRKTAPFQQAPLVSIGPIEFSNLRSDSSRSCRRGSFALGWHVSDLGIGIVSVFELLVAQFLPGRLRSNRRTALSSLG